MPIVQEPTSSRSRRCRVWLAATVAAFCFAGPSKAASDNEAPTLVQIVENLLAAAPFGREKVERAINAKLSARGGGPAYEGFFGAKHVLLKDATLEFVDFRGRDATNAASGFVMLRLLIADTCRTRAEIKKSYNPPFVYIDSHMGPGGLIYLERNESWGRLSFGFPFEGPDCLRDIIFNNKA